jgi:hypothetical protein
MENTTMNNDGIDFAEAKSAADKILDGVLDSSKQVANLCRAYLALEKEKAAAEDAKLRQERESVRKEVIDAILRDEARDAVAPGWNPENHTVRQIGVGYRTLTAEEVAGMHRFKFYGGLEYMSPFDGKWLCSFNFGPDCTTYRTQKPAGFFLPKDPLDDVAEGHNPGQLTKRQVGYQYGWRTLSQDEAMCHDPSIDRTDAQLWQQSENKWKERYFPKECFSHDTYRTRKPKGYYLPKPAPVVDLSKCRVGQKLKRRDGSITVFCGSSQNPHFPYTDGTYTYKSDGSLLTEEHHFDIIEVLPHEEPAPKLVPFTAATFPKGEVWVRQDSWNDGTRHLVRAVLDYGVYTIREDQMLPYSAEGFQHSLDGGRTWLPWGTMEGGAK